MSAKTRVLWVEDGALFDLPQMAAPIYIDGRFDLAIAESVTNAITLIKQQQYHVVIVDLRLPPGNDSEWIELFKKLGADKVSARLGLKFLYSILGHPNAIIPLEDRPDWVCAERFGILSVERYDDLAEGVQDLGIKHYTQKVANLPDTALLELIEAIIDNQK